MTSSVERKNLENGKPNAKYVDVLDEDNGIAGQKFTCMSFLSPEKILDKRETFLFNKFVQQWNFSKSMSKFGDFLNFISYKYNLNAEIVMNDYTDFCKEEQERLKEDSVFDDYQTFLDKNEESLNQTFQRDHEFQTSVRGLKNRGNFASQEEAEQHCKKLRDKDPNHDIFVAPVGVWLPWDPNAYKTGRVEFMEEELNKLHQEKIKNELKAKENFDKRVKDTKESAIADNIKKAKESGNVLTQTLNDDGELVGVRDMVDFTTRDVSNDTDREAHESELIANSQTDTNITTSANIKLELDSISSEPDSV
jgi:hypothetical protein